MEKSTDKELMNLVLKKNSHAFKILYQRYELAIFNFIFKYTSSREIAQDLLQETFTRVWFAAHLFDYEGGNFRGWLYTIALNTTRNEMSKKRYTYQYLDVSEIKGEQEPVQCENEVNGGAFCPYCGFDLASTMCPQCQYPIKPEWSFCPSCRTELRKKAEVVPKKEKAVEKKRKEKKAS